MAQREKTFKKPSYRVNKRILERCVGVNCDTKPRFQTLSPLLPDFDFNMCQYIGYSFRGYKRIWCSQLSGVISISRLPVTDVLT